MRVLVIAAHPDDEVLGCGAAMAKHAMDGDEVFVLILGDGITSRYSMEELKSEVVSKQVYDIRGHALVAGSILGAQTPEVKNNYCCRFDNLPLLDITKTIEKKIKEVQPEVVYTHCGDDANNDHRIIFQATMVATRPVPGVCVKKVLLFEILSSTEWNFKGNFRPNVYVDVTQSVDKKIKAFRAYQNEIRNYPHPRSEDGIISLAKKRGSEVGFQYAEAFELFRSLED